MYGVLKMTKFIKEINDLLNGIKTNKNARIKLMVIDLLRVYKEHHRYYHTISHIKDCFVEFREVKKLFNFPLLMKYALLYHDYVYIPSYIGNESASASKAIVNARELGFDPDIVSATILATKHSKNDYCHIKSSTEKTLIFEDIKLVMDIDLSIFGQNTKKFLEYEKNIRKEYWFIPEEKFKEGRTEILKDFLLRDRIYFSDHFYKKYEIKARKNLTYSIELLNSDNKDMKDGTPEPEATQPG